MFVCHDESPASAFRAHHSVCSYTKKLKATSGMKSEHVNAVNVAVIVFFKRGKKALEANTPLNGAPQQPFAAIPAEF